MSLYVVTGRSKYTPVCVHTAAATSSHSHMCEDCCALFICLSACASRVLPVVLSSYTRPTASGPVRSTRSGSSVARAEMILDTV
ncbi:hypothetical protein GCM10009637_09030 [Brevibacterium luteolum]